MTKPSDIDELNYANMARLRTEVGIIAARLRRALLAEYREQWNQSLSDGMPLRLTAGADVLDRLALDAAIKTFGGQNLLTDG